MPGVTGTKRKSTDGPDAIATATAAAPIDLDSIQIPIGTKIDSPQVVRGKINRFIENGEMKIGEFCDTLGVSGNAYRRFLAGNGKEGSQSDTYIAAFEFFKKRELAGIKPAKKQKTSAASATQDVSPDLSNVHVPGEENDAVQVYETRDEIRKKIAAHLRKPGVTRAQFCRDLHAMYHTEKAPSQVQSAQLTRFMGQKGPYSGNTSCVFYAAYVYFEKLRIKENKPKSKHREEMEKIWGAKGGFDISRNHSTMYYTCRNDERPHEDSYGRVEFY